MIIDGRTMASDILAEVRATHAATLVVRAIVVTPSAATQSYLRIKTARATEAGMRLEVVHLPDDAKDADVIAAIQAPGADAVIVQLPLPETINQQIVVDAIPLTKDADVLGSAAYDSFLQGTPGALMPPVAAAIQEILARSNVTLEHKNIVVIGRGKLVGRPVATWLLHEGITPTIIDRSDGALDPLRDADIIISGAGQAGLITSDMIKDGVVIIDAGTSESNGAIAGDADPACAEKASVFTPVPGGVGPVAVACLFRNAAKLQ